MKEIKEENYKVIKQREKLIGTKYMTNQGYEVTIIDYQNNRNVTIEFENGYKCVHELVVIKRGNVNNPYHRSVYGVGYIGEGNAPISEGKKRTKVYTCWISMLKRCYEERFQQKSPTYKGCTVTEEWHCFQTFAKWYEENYYQVDNEEMALDKDILVKGNKVYGPETCVFVPPIINGTFTKRKNKKSNLPLGITAKSDKSGKFVARCVNYKTGKREYVGEFKSLEEAFKAYKECKEKYIKELADDYRDKIPEKLYNAMYNYKVEIND